MFEKARADDSLVKVRGHLLSTRRIVSHIQPALQYVRHRNTIPVNCSSENGFIEARLSHDHICSLTRLSLPKPEVLKNIACGAFNVEVRRNPADEAKPVSITRCEQCQTSTFIWLPYSSEDPVQMLHRILRGKQPACTKVQGPALENGPPFVKEILESNEVEKPFIIDEVFLLPQGCNEARRARHRNAGDSSESHSVDNRLVDALTFTWRFKAKFWGQSMADENLQHPLTQIRQEV